MSKICPECKAEFGDNIKFCSECGSRLKDKVEEHTLLSIGDANAISGGVHIDNSKTIDSHDVHYHTIKNEKETALELNARYQNEVLTLCSNGVISTEARIKLDSLKLQLGITNDVANKIEENIRKAVVTKAKKENEQLSPTAQMILDETIESIEHNSPKAYVFIDKLAGLQKLTDDDRIDFYYNMLLAAFEPGTLIERYEKHDADSYWKAFWACIAYRITENKKQAEISLSELQVHWNDRPHGDVVLNMCIGILWENDGVLDKCKDRIGKYLQKCSRENVSDLLCNLYSAFEWLIDDNKKVVEEVYIWKEDKETGKSKMQLNLDDDNPSTIFYRYTFIPSTKDAFNLFMDVEYAHDDGTFTHEQIIERYEKAAKYGSCNAMSELGDIYGERAEEFGFDENEEEIEKKKLFWKKRAAQAGDNHSARDLYVEYKNTQKYEAVEWLQIAANRKDCRAMNMLANEYCNYEDNYYHKEAAKLYEDVILKDGHADGAEAKFGLGKMYLLGKGIEKNERKGIELLEASVDYGNINAMDYLGCCYMNGCGVEKNYEKAIGLFKQTIERDDYFSTEALIHLGQCYLREGDKEDNYQKAYESFLKATKLASYNQSPAAHDWLGYCYCNGYGVEIDLSKAIDCFSQATKCYAYNNMEPSASYYCHVADTYLKCKNIDEAKNMFIKAAEAGNAESMWKLACLYSNGYLKKDIKIADSWLKKAAEAGYEDAQKRMSSHGTMLEENPTSSSANNTAIQDQGSATNNEPQLATQLYNERMELGMPVKRTEQSSQSTESASSTTAIDNQNASATLSSVNQEQAQKLYDEALSQQTLSVRISRMEKAAKAGSPNAMLFMAKAYISGVETNRNERIAIEYCNRAIALGLKEASILLQAINDNSYSTEQVSINHEESYYKYKESFSKSGRINKSRMKHAAEGGSVDAMLFLAKAYRDGTYEYEADEQYSRMWFQKAAYCGSDEARKVLGIVSKNVHSSPSHTNSDNAPLGTAPQSKIALKDSKPTIQEKDKANDTPTDITRDKRWWTKPLVLKIVLVLACFASFCMVISGFSSSDISCTLCVWAIYLYLLGKSRE